MSWVPVYDDVTRHEKTRVAADELRISRHQLVGHLVAFWTWAVDKAPEGGPLRGEDIAYAAEWTKGDAKFVRALVHAGFLEPEDDGRYRIHDWDDGGGRVMRTRKGNRDRKKRQRSLSGVTRDGDRDDMRDTERDDLQDVTRKSRVQRRGEERREDPPLPPQGGEGSSGSPEGGGSVPAVDLSRFVQRRGWDSEVALGE